MSSSDSVGSAGVDTFDSEAQRLRYRLIQQVNSLEPQLNMKLDPEMFVEQRASLILDRLNKDRRQLLLNLAEALRTLALVMEAEQQIGKSSEVYWTHADRKAIATLIIGMCKSRLAGSRWVDESIAYLTKEDIAGEF